MDENEIATYHFAEGFNCSQSVLMAHAEAFGISEDLAARLAAPFGGGFSRQGEICGAVTGAMMVLGLQNASTNPDDAEAKNRMYQHGQDYCNRFKTEFGSIHCRDLTGFNLIDPQELAKARQSGVFTDLCPKLVEEAVQILKEMENEKLP